MKATIMMVMVQIVMGGVNIFYKLAANDGMSLSILVAYRFIFAAVFVLPLAFFVDRKRKPKLTWAIMLQGFFCALFGGAVAQNLYTQCLVLTSATFASAMSNLIPAFTFLLAIFFRLEKLGLDKIEGKAKVVGTLICIGGAMLLTFYKGSEIKIWSSTVDLSHKSQHPSRHVLPSHLDYRNRLLGALLGLLSCFAGAISLIFQAKMSEKYPFPYSGTALISVTGSIQAVVLALCIERDWKQWKLEWNIRLLAVTYTGTVASGLMVIFIMWCVRMRGPLFVSVFSPLMLVVVAVAGTLFLREKMHLGSVLGAAVIVCGLYMVLWAKGKEIKRTQIMPSKEPNQQQIVLVLQGTSDDASLSINSSSPVRENNEC